MVVTQLISDRHYDGFRDRQHDGRQPESVHQRSQHRGQLRVHLNRRFGNILLTLNLLVFLSLDVDNWLILHQYVADDNTWLRVP